MRCPDCSFENPQGLKFCEECGTRLPRVCPSCGRQVRPTAKFCGECGTALGAEGKPALAKGRRQKGAKTPGRAPRRAARPTTAPPPAPEAERRHLTVMFCDLVGSTPLAEKLDPEDLRQVILAYQQTCAEQIQRFDGYLARYVGDGLLVYFGYPQAHEDDAQRAIRAGLGIIAELPQLNDQVQVTVGAHGQRENPGRSRAPTELAVTLPPLHVRIGIHTGLVVVGDMGGGGYRDPLAIVGETPNIAARLQGIAEPNTVVISEATARLVQGLFEYQAQGPQALKGVSTPVAVYRVLRESEAQSRFEASVRTGLTPLVGREEELGLLQRRWEQAKVGEGQAVLLSGEPGIGKSRLAQTLKEHASAEDATRIEFRCSAYHQNSAFYPIIEHLQRFLQFVPHDTPQAKLGKLQQVLAAYRFAQTDTLPLFASLLSLPHPAGTPPLTLSPQKQKQKTQEALVAWIVEEAEKAAVYCAWEDLHWADPSTLEVLALFLEQIPTTRVFTILTFRPTFTPPWGARSYLTPLTLSRLGRPQIEAMVDHVVAQTLRPSTSSGRAATGLREETTPARAEPVEARTALPPEVVQQIIAKTDGVPLFVEELTKMVLESGLVTAAEDHYRLTGSLPPLAIPSTLRDSLMARLDRLSTVREIAQLGATIGREFSYEVLRTVSPLGEGTLRQGLQQLIEAELIYRRGLPPQATYSFKHALVQDAAYQSLLKSKRQRYHQQIAQVLEERFIEITETQPELLAHHYTEAGLIAQAIPHWQRAGQKAVERSANVEAIAHLMKGLDLLQTLPDTLERAQQELTLQITLGAPSMATKGVASPEVERVYVRARELCQQVGDTARLFPVLWGLWFSYLARAELQTARETGEQLLTLAQSVQDTGLLVEADVALGAILFHLGEFVLAREHLEQGIALYDSQMHRSHVFVYGTDPGVNCRTWISLVLWFLGYPDQALARSSEAITLARETSHSFSLGDALDGAVWVHRLRREGQATQEQAEALMAFSREQEIYLWGEATMFRGWALAEQGQEEEGMAQIRQGLAPHSATESECVRPHFLALLAEACGKAGQAKEGLASLYEALTAIDKNVGRFYEAELYRLKGQLTLQQFKVSVSTLQAENSRVGIAHHDATVAAAGTVGGAHPTGEEEAEACFLKAIAIARGQSAKSLELRAAVSLSRLWRRQGKKTEAHRLLAEIYGWFTEGFDTKDVQEAKTLLHELRENTDQDETKQSGV